MDKTNNIVILDADGLIALINTEDANHKEATTISSILTRQSMTILMPVTGIIEAITALKRGINRPDLAKKLVQMYSEGQIAVSDVSADILLSLFPTSTLMIQNKILSLMQSLLQLLNNKTHEPSSVLTNGIKNKDLLLPQNY